MLRQILQLCTICYVSIILVAGRVVPYYDLDDDFYSDIRNILEEHLSKKAADQIGRPQEVLGWGPNITFGQVASVTIDSEGNPVIFHRGSRTWNFKSFNSTQHFQETTPIEQPVVVTLDKLTGSVLNSWGARKFYLPHGITIDAAGNIWLTDVGLHQVIKYPPKSDTPSLTLGEKFQPGTDNKHFCKPTAVAVTSSGDFFVADGYCNARVIQFGPDGSFKRQYGHRGTERDPLSLNVPHGLALNEALDVLCIADREHARIICIRTGLSEPETFGQEALKLQDPNHIRIFDVAFYGNLLMGVVGSEEEGIAVGFTADIEERTVVDEWLPVQGFHNPHSIAVDAKRNSLYVSEVGPNRVWKFNLELDQKLY